VTILTGFLGAGKTTLLNQLMQSKGDEKVIIIVNEFGDTSIDHELVLVDEDERIFQMNNGCMCCILREDLAEMFLDILTIVKESGIAIHRVIIETSGLAEPSPIAQTIVRTPLLNEHFMIDSILTLVDTQNAEYQLDHYPEATEQVAFADRLLLTKTEAVPKQELHVLKQKLAKINPFIDQECVHGNLQFADLIGLQLFDHGLDNEEIEADIDHMIDNHEHHHHDHESHEHHHVHTPVNSFVIRLEEALPEKQVILWIRQLIQLYGMDLMRYKGLLNIEGYNQPVVLQGVNMAFRLEEGESWQEKPITKIVLIGKELPEAEIRALLVNQHLT
jgi:G3E family GTPase